MFETVTFALVAAAVLFAASRARADSVCAPFVADVVFQFSV